MKTKVALKSQKLWKEFQKLYAAVEENPCDFQSIAKLGVIGEEWKKAFMEEVNG